MATTQPLTLNDNNNENLDNILVEIEAMEQQEQADKVKAEQIQQDKEQAQEQKDFEKSIYTEQEFIDSMLSIMSYGSEATGLQSLQPNNYVLSEVAFSKLYHLCKRNKLLRSIITKTEGTIVDLGIVLAFGGQVGYAVYKELKHMEQQSKQQEKEQQGVDIVQATAEPVN